MALPFEFRGNAFRKEASLKDVQRNNKKEDPDEALCRADTWETFSTTATIAMSYCGRCSFDPTVPR